jgi:hypothetical protein
MRDLRSLVLSLAVPLLAGATPFAAQGALYKWVDERGVVNYGDRPPAGAKQVAQLEEATSSLSVVPGLSKEQLAELRERDAQARIERLERELADLRDRPPLPAPPAYDATAYAPFVRPVLVVRHPPLRPVHRQPPVQGKPVQRTPPFAGLRLER